MIARKLKMILTLGVVGLLGGAAPAMAHGPRYDTRFEFAVGAPTWHVGFGFDRPAPAPVVDYRQLRQGQSLEAQGQELVDRGQRLEWKGKRYGIWHLVRRGERLQSQGYELIREGRDLQNRARW